MDAEEAAPRLLVQARTHLAGGNAGIELLAHIHGRPIYAMVDQAGTPDASLMLGLTAANEEGNARAVTIREEDLARVAPETLLTAVTAWANATDSGGRPVLDYAPTAKSREPLPRSSATGRRPPAEEAQAPQAGAAAPAPAIAAPTRDREMGQATAAQNNQAAEGLSGKPGAAVEAAGEAVPEAPAAAQGPSTTSSPSASTIVGLFAIGHGVPADVALPAMLLAPVLAEHLPGRLDARARLHVRSVEGDGAVRCMQRLAAALVSNS
ncbi:hypothetical protein [Streptomyces sp. NPDC051636]|uniref:hypothetical protein n=1 Tax=Streptomyces sp. NPDC051636 TaxID=3365663 RepID=UPI003792B48A